MTTELFTLTSADNWLELLTEPERLVADAAKTGEPLDLRNRTREDAPVGDAARWDAILPVRARVIEMLVLGERPDWPLHRRGLNLTGARLDGVLNLDFANVTARLRLTRCTFTDPPQFNNCAIAELDLAGSRVPGLRANGISATGNVILCDGFKSNGTVELGGAKVGGHLVCDNGSFRSEHGTALHADSITVGGNIFMRNDFSASGMVRLPDAKIDGNLSCVGGSVENKTGTAMYAARIAVTGNVFLRDGFTATGEVRLFNARIGGYLNCAGGTFDNPNGNALACDGASVDGDILLREGFVATGAVRLPATRIGGSLDGSGDSFTSFIGCSLMAEDMSVGGTCQFDGAAMYGGVDVTRVEVARDLRLCSGLAVTGTLDLSGARIGGALRMNDADLHGDPTALVADRIEVGQDLDGRGLTAHGTVKLRGHVKGLLDLSKSHMISERGPALFAEGLRVDHAAFFRNTTTAGEVRLPSARIGGRLYFDGAHLQNPTGSALDAARLNVDEDLYFREGFVAAGDIDLTGAHISGDVSFTGASLTAPAGSTASDEPETCALDAQGLHVAGDVQLNHGFEACGEVKLRSAQIGGQLTCMNGTFTSSSGTALDCIRVAVAHEFILAMATFTDGTISVSGASVGVLYDDDETDGESSVWPDGWSGAGFTYDLATRASADPERRIAWIERQDRGFRSGSYTHLANLYRQRGDIQAARRVLIGRERRRSSTLPRWRRPLHWLWGVVSAYGYKSWRVIGALAVVIVVAGIVFAGVPMAELGEPAERVTFIPWVYALDLAVPLVDLRQAGDYQPEQTWAQAVMWATIVLGWVLSLAFVAAVTGFFESDE